MVLRKVGQALRFGSLAALALLFVIGCVESTGGDKMADAIAAEPAEHPELDGEEMMMECHGCHVEATPDVVDQWYASPHGKNSVKCFVCHGAVDEDFVAQPGTDFCVSCHDEQVESMADALMEGKDCYTCHPNHLLVPHLSVEEGGAQ